MTRERPTVDYENAENLILFRLHLALTRSESFRTELGYLARYLQLPEALVAICANRLEQWEQCQQREDTNLVEHPETGRLVDVHETHLEITESGVSAVEGWSTETYNWVEEQFRARLLKNEPNLITEADLNWLESYDSVADAEVSDEPEDAEVDDAWEPLSIDRESPSYVEFDEKLDDAIEKIEADNGYAATHPDERNTVVWSLKEGLRAVRELSPSMAQLKTLILSALNKAIQTLKESAPGVAATLARDAFKEWIKSLL